MKVPTRSKGLLASAALFAVSLALPAVTFRLGDGTDWLPGLTMLLLGWFDVFTGVVGWLANPLYGAGAVALVLRRRGLAVALFGGAVGLALSSVQLFHEGLMKDESGQRHAVEHFGPGFYVWLAALVVGLLAAVVREKPAVTT